MIKKTVRKWLGFFSKSFKIKIVYLCNFSATCKCNKIFWADSFFSEAPYIKSILPPTPSPPTKWPSFIYIFTRPSDTKNVHNPSKDGNQQLFHLVQTTMPWWQIWMKVEEGLLSLLFNNAIYARRSCLRHHVTVDLFTGFLSISVPWAMLDLLKLHEDEEGICVLCERCYRFIMALTW